MFKITDGKGFHITFANGWTASVQWGLGSYSSNGRMPERMGVRDFTEQQRIAGKRGSTTAEIAFWHGDGSLRSFPDWGDEVKGYVSADEVATFLATVAALAPDAHL